MKVKQGSSRQVATMKEREAMLTAEQKAEQQKMFNEMVQNIKNYNMNVQTEEFTYCVPKNTNIVVQLFMIPDGSLTKKRPFVGRNATQEQKLFRNMQPFETFGVVKAVDENSKYKVGDTVSLAEAVVNKIGHPEEQHLQYQLEVFGSPLYGYVIFPEHMIESIITEKLTFEPVISDLETTED